VYFVKGRVPTSAKMQLSFERLEVLARFTSASVITSHLSHNIRLAALIQKYKKRSSVSAEVCGRPPTPVWIFLSYKSFGVVISRVNLQLF